MRADDFRAAFRTAQTPTASTVHEPVGKPGGPGLWHHKGLQLPPYIQHVANDLRGQGHDESTAVEMAVGIVKNWAAGHDGHGNRVHPDVQAAAAKNVAQWEALKASHGGARRFNPYHKGPGPLGGEFTSGGSGGGGSGGKKPGAGKHAAAAAKYAPHAVAGDARHKAALLAQAHADREKAHQLEAELRLVEAQIRAANAANAKAAAAAKKSAAAAKAAGHKKSTTVTHHHAAAHHKAASHHAATAASLQAKAGRLREQIKGLLGQARSLDKQAAAIRSADAVWARSWHQVWIQGSEAASGG